MFTSRSELNSEREVEILGWLNAIAGKSSEGGGEWLSRLETERLGKIMGSSEG